MALSTVEGGSIKLDQLLQTASGRLWDQLTGRAAVDWRRQVNCDKWIPDPTTTVRHGQNCPKAAAAATRMHFREEGPRIVEEPIWWLMKTIHSALYSHIHMASADSRTFCIAPTRAAA
jgi:hypothetical protein